MLATADQGRILREGEAVDQPGDLPMRTAQRDSEMLEVARRHVRGPGLLVVSTGHTISL